VRADEADIHRTLIKMYHNHQPVFIPFDIKDVPVVSHRIHAVKGLFYIRKTFPVGPARDLIPAIQRLRHIGMVQGEIRQYGFRYDDPLRKDSDNFIF